MADDALAVADAASAVSAHVYGVSMGGFIALRPAPLRPRQSPVADPRADRRLGGGRVAWRHCLHEVRFLAPAAALN